MRINFFFIILCVVFACGAQAEENHKLETLILNRPAVPITKPQDYKKAEDAGAGLPSDGSMAVSRRCRIKLHKPSGWWLVILEGRREDPSPAPRWAIPCRLLEKVEQIVRDKPKTIFRISGENTIYDERSFILLQKVELDTTTPWRTFVPPAPAPVETTTMPTASAATQPSTAPAAQDGVVPPSHLPEGSTSDDILKALRKDAGGIPVVESVKPKGPGTNESSASVAPLPDKSVLSRQRGSIVVDRLVTVIPTGKGRWLQVRFESDNTLREPPFSLLPCQMLRNAELIVASAEKGKTLRLRITGLLTFYKGKRYMLLRKAILERDLGRF